MNKKDDDSRVKVITKIVDFLLEESLQIDKHDLKIEIYVNVCKFLKEWYIRREELILAEKTFECLIKLISSFEQTSSKMLVYLIDFMLKKELDYTEKPYTMIDLVNMMEKPKKRRYVIDLMMAVLAAVLAAHRSEKLRPLKPILVKLLSEVLVQSNTVWNMCLKYEDDYKQISCIKDKLGRIDDFVVYYIQETDKLGLLYDRLRQVLKESEKSTLDSTTMYASITDISNASFLDLKSIRRYELKEDTHRELRLSKNKTGNNQENIISINKRQAAMTLWFKDRNDNRMSQLERLASRYIEFEGNKRFVLSFSDPEMDNLYHKRGFQYLLSVSGTLSIDYCSRKMLVVKKRFEELNIKQKFSSLKEEFVDVRVKVTSPLRRQKTFEIPRRKSNHNEDVLQIESTLNIASSDDEMRKKDKDNKISKKASTSRTSSENRTRGEKDRGGLIVADKQDTNITKPKKKMSDTMEDEDKRFEYLFDILGFCFGIDDKISVGYNVGMMVKDWNYPMDCVLLIGEKAMYIKTNFMIRYEKEGKTLINLISKDEVRSYHLGKYYMEIEEMTKPFSEDARTKNKFRKDKAEKIDRLYEIPYSDLTEIYSKQYIGRCPIALEMWTKQRRPFFVVFNIHQLADAWNLILENWFKTVNFGINESLRELKASFNLAIAINESVFVYKIVDETVGRPTLRVTRGEELIYRLRKKWISGYMDNFTYLMAINGAAGRSLKFISSYYIFPQIVRDYSILPQLKDACFRDLAKPMGVVTRKEVESLVEKYKHSAEGEGFHHGSLYSNKNILEHFLYRVMPYTQYQFDLNSGRVDSVGRMFKNFQVNFTLSAEINFFEMIPENYYLEQYLVNTNNLAFYEEFDLDNVELPDWANQNPRLFTLTMRRALECDVVTKGLGKWIDLIFGIAQYGNEAVKRINVFQPGNYLLGPDAIKELRPDNPRFVKEKEKCHLAFAYPFQCGQVPSLLFKEEHPTKNFNFDLDKMSVLFSIMAATDQTYVLQKYTNPNLEKLDNNFQRMSQLSHLSIHSSQLSTFGPLGHIFASIRDLKNR
jgi:hypothetical protein